MRDQERKKCLVLFYSSALLTLNASKPSLDVICDFFGKCGIEVVKLEKADLVEYWRKLVRINAVSSSESVSAKKEHSENKPVFYQDIKQEHVIELVDEVIDYLALYPELLGSLVILEITNYRSLVIPTVSEYRFVPLSPLFEPFMIMPSGVVLSSSVSSAGHQVDREAEHHHWHYLLNRALKLPVALQLPDECDVASADIAFMNSSTCFVGSGNWTSEESIRCMLDAKVFGTNRVVLVRNLFDLNLDMRPFLDSVLFVVDENVVAVNASIVDSSNPSFTRLVQEYVMGDSGYELMVNNMELVRYLKYRKIEVISVPETLFFRSLALLRIAPRTFLIAENQQELASYYKEKCPNIAYSIWSYEACFLQNLAHSVIFESPIWKVDDPVVMEDASSLEEEELSRVCYPICPRVTDDESCRRRQTTNRILMVAPIGFCSNQQTLVDNNFASQESELTPDVVERFALLEFGALYQALVRAGIQIQLVRNERFFHAPDSVFPNNWFSTHSGREAPHGVSTLVLYPMKAPSRRAERRPHIVRFLQSLYPKTVDLSFHEQDDKYLEGTGALVLDRVNKIAYSSLSKRSDKELVLKWCKTFEYEPIVFSATEDEGRPIYHTNTIMWIGTCVAVVCLDMIKDPGEQELVRSSLSAHRELIAIAPPQVAAYCGNVLELSGESGQKILVMSKSAYDGFGDTIRQFENRSYRIIAAEIDNIQKFGGGGARCMIAELF
ncbi:uncharacterized protein LOC126329971 [Schistocerca gregaria]|uniref:uncharacterized protein LOC126329971 n=1 Tax=Schistocerca gregaria TaxID=7010 RepID=UPI00211E34A8|nr:uncharacterized protein LOC126329971 [Schistocerca gregaria]